MTKKKVTDPSTAIVAGEELTIEVKEVVKPEVKEPTKKEKYNSL